MRSHTWKLAVVVPFALVACGGDEGAKDDTKDPTPGPTRMEKTVGATGGELALDGAGVVVEIPAGALSQDVTLQARVLPPSEWPAGLAAHKLAGPVLELLPDGLTFASPITITWALSAATGFDGDPASAPLVVGSVVEADGSLTPHDDASVAADGGEVRVSSRVSHFSRHAPVGYRFAPGGIEALPADSEYLELVAAFRKNFAYVGESVAPRSLSLSPVDLGAQGLYQVSAWTTAPDVLVPSLAPSNAFAPDAPSAGDGRISFPPRSFPDSTPVVGLIKPAFRCTSVGSDTLRIGLAARFTRASSLTGTVRLDMSVGLDFLCNAAPTRTREDAVLVGETQRLQRSGDALVPTGGLGTVANVQHLTDAEAAHFAAAGAGTLLYEGVGTFASSPGPAQFDFELETRSLHAARNGDTYDFTVFDPDELGRRVTMSAAAVGDDEPVVEELESPPRMPANAIETLDGLTSTVAVPDTLKFDALFVAASATGSATPGKAGVSRLVPAADMSASGGMLRAPLFPPETVAELTARGLTLGTIYVGLVNETLNTAWFGEPHPTHAQALSALLIPAAALAAPVTTGGATVAACSALPADFPETETPGTGFGQTAVVCVAADDSCFVSNDTYEDFPTLSPGQCSGPAGSRAFALGFNAASIASACAGNWGLIWSSTGVQNGGQCMNTPLASSTTYEAIVRHPLDARQYRVDFSYTGLTYNVASVQSFAGAVPDYGVQFDCRTLPRSFPLALTPTEDAASVCLSGVSGQTSPGICSVLGDVNVSTQAERCTSGRVPLRFFYAEGISQVVASRGSSQWSITTASAGTVSTSYITNLPEDVDIAAQVTEVASGAVVTVTFRYDNPGVTVVSVAE